MRRDLATAVAGVLLAGPWERDAAVQRARVVTGRPAPWLRALVTEVLALYRDPPLDRPRELAKVLIALAPPGAGNRRPRSWQPVETSMLHNPWRLPVLDTVADLTALLDLPPDGLGWYSDPRGLARSAADPPLQHYRASWVTAASGAIRVIEAPKPRLRAMQRHLLATVLHRIPPHPAAHGFRPARSVATYAAPHAGQPVLLRLDLEGFFASVTAARTFGVLRTAGYPEPVAHALTGVLTSVLPRTAWARIPRPSDVRMHDAHWRLGRRLAAPHLPQGAPTSPVLANLAAYRLDVRLLALAESWGGRYTRYADDLAFSGSRGWLRGTSRLIDAVETVVRDEAFRLNARKTAVLPSAGRQVLGGLVVNERPHVSRREVDRLRAVLHNCERRGPSMQNRDQHADFAAHLAGRVSWVAQHDAVRGAQLREMYGRIDWTR